MSTEDTPTAMPRDMLADRLTEVEQRWYAAEAELARIHAQLAEARAALARVAAATRATRRRVEGCNAQANAAHMLAAQALRTPAPERPKPPPEPQPDPDPYHPDRHWRPGQPRAVAA